MFSQVVTLYITPVYYVYLDQVQHKWSEWRGKRKSRLAPRVADESFAGSPHD